MSAKHAMSKHDGLVVIDGLIVSKFSRTIFEDMRRGGLTAANCTCSIWENFRDSIDNIVHFNALIRDNADLVVLVRSTADIVRAKRERKTGIILGWQNTSGIEDQLGYIEIFKELGVQVMQLTYNTQNLSGTGCRESHDGGLSDFGREVIDEMGRVGVLCDLSHVGPQTSEDAIRHAKQPLAFTHCCPAGLLDHPRNKSDMLIKLIADKGGMIGVTMFPWFLPRGNNSTIDDYVEAIEYVVNVGGEDHVGIGSDYTQDQTPDFDEWLSHDKGYARKLFELSDTIFPEGIKTIGDAPNLTATMEKRGWPDAKIEKVLGQNWLNLFHRVWNER